MQAMAASAQTTSEEDELSLVYGDSDSISLATGNLQTLRRAPAVAVVLTAADIANMGLPGMDEVLETVAGIHIAHSANTLAPLYMVRGVYSSQGPQVLVLQNGVPITTLVQGNKGNLWGNYPVELISRLEIIRGPGSALYGSDAFAGVINIITKGSAELAGTEFGARAGSFSSRDAWVLHGGKLGPVDIAAYVRVGDTDGFHRTVDADAQTRNDTLLGTHASLAPGSVNVDNKAADVNLEAGYGQFRARFNYKQREQGSGAGIASALDPVGKGRSTRIIGNLIWSNPQLTKDWGLTASLNSQEFDQEIPVPYILLPAGTRFPTGPFPNGMIGAPETWERNVRLSVVADYSGLEDHHFRVGAGHEDLHLFRTRELRNFTYAPNGTPIPTAAGLTDFSNTDVFLRPHRRRIDYVFIQDEWRLAKDWNLTAGVRHDKYSDFGGTTNPRIALVWDATYDVTTKLLYGRAFRAPSFNEAYSITNPVALGNPNLKPETNGTLEAVASWQAKADLQLNATLYRYSMASIIRLTPRPAGALGQVYNNTGNQTGRGVELESAWTVDRDLRLVGNYAWQRSIDKATNKDAGYAPHHHLYARADWQFSSGLMLSPQLTWVADRKRPVGDLRAPVADYHTVDLSLSTRRGKNSWNFTAAVRNLFNADVREPSAAPGLQIPHDLPMAPRAISLTAAYKL
ncbi:TonB-dependent receptor [Duganella ginsengisoli]|uniref:TonB-dependent receptor n=2 Tax=Pseudoduganella ginsengisoli TaxID=1462440 RepID=A0A6L6Q6L9_9BURK|nr:TonB-dependent receptor [Pseudoduganella ginsengisoli]